MPRDIGMKMKKQNIRTLALIVCTFTYLLIGAAIFDALESKKETTEREKLETEAKDIQRCYNISDKDFDKLRANFIKYRPYHAGIQWKFAGSFYFSLSVITTIGYGHSTPKTMGGKAFCILYALLGIPLNIVMFQSIGERFNIGITVVMRRFKQCFHLSVIKVTQSELTVVALVLCVMVLLGGAASFQHFESWPFFEAFYYCFITMSTIGFGDYVALQNVTDNALQSRPEYVAFSILYILFGLTVFAAALNLMVLRLLTMNTQDERKDELEAIAAARGAVKIDGDIIIGAGSFNPVLSNEDSDGVTLQPDSLEWISENQYVNATPRTELSSLPQSESGQILYSNGLAALVKNRDTLNKSISIENPFQRSWKGATMPLGRISEGTKHQPRLSLMATGPDRCSSYREPNTDRSNSSERLHKKRESV